MVFSPNFEEKISKTQFGAKRKKTQKEPHKRAFFKATKKLICTDLSGLASTGTGTITLDPTFGSFTLLEPVSH